MYSGVTDSSSIQSQFKGAFPEIKHMYFKYELSGKVEQFIEMSLLTFSFAFFSMINQK